jgi:hypothetical protein
MQPVEADAAMAEEDSEVDGSEAEGSEAAGSEAGWEVAGEAKKEEG